MQTIMCRTELAPPSPSPGNTSSGLISPTAIERGMNLAFIPLTPHENSCSQTRTEDPTGVNYSWGKYRGLQRSVCRYSCIQTVRLWQVDSAPRNRILAALSSAFQRKPQWIQRN